MSKFKVGDTVKVVKEEMLFDRSFVGRTAEVIRVDNDGDYELENIDICMFERQLELVKVKEFSKADMQIGQAFKTRCGSVLSWEGRMPEYYKDDLTDFDSDTAMDIIEVYPFNLTPIWKREEPKYRVKTELNKEQAEKLGLEFCEVIE